MSKRLLFPLIVAAASLVPAAPTLAATQVAASENWAGYVATPNSASGFSAVSGDWTEPAAKCTDNTADSYASFWVGLGGGDEQSDALEQIGTQANCNADGSATYYAWYELVPAAPVKLAVTIHPGDKVYARTAVNGDDVKLELTDKTTGHSWSKTLTMSDPSPDTTTADWVAEAPSACGGGDIEDCTPLPLANFGTATFTDAYATAGGHTGTISDSHWSATPIELLPSDLSLLGGGYGGYGRFSDYGGYEAQQSDSAGAAPTSLSDHGASFKVKYGASVESGTSGSGRPQPDGYYGGYGAGAGDGYGFGAGNSYGSGYGYGGYSYQGGGWGGYGSWGGGWGGY